MKYLSPFWIILGFTLMGEVLQRAVPLPIPASVYGLVLLFTALCLKIVRLEQVRETGTFLVSILPPLFISPTVGILEDWGLIREDLTVSLLLMVASTVLAFGVGGRITQKLMKNRGEQNG